jgi:hypothetical protein
VVIDAYSGAMTMYAFDTKDPILAAYRAAFPSLFQPLSSMPAGIQAHLRYPQDLFAAQAATWGRYHITAPAAFYSSSDRWEVSPTTGSGAPSNGLSQTQVTNSVGATVSLTNSPMDPLYQVMSLPNERRQQLTLSTAFVPFGQSSTVQGLTAFLIATNEPDNYGQLNGYVTPRGTTVTGPVQAASSINQNQRVSPIITQLDQHGSNVLLGHTLMIPLDKSVLYVRPLYVSSTANPLPQLKYVIAVFNSDVGIEPTLSAALSDVLGGNVNTGGGGTSSGGTAASYLAQAIAAYNAAQTALKSGNLANYQADITQMGQYLQLAQTALAAGR